MIQDIEYLSAKTLHQTDDPTKPIQGTGAIIASQGKYYLATALHCMRLKDDNGNEIVKPDWRKMSAQIYLKDKEVDITFTGLLDADENDDYALLTIEKPLVDFDYPGKTRLTDKYTRSDTFGAYGYPKDIEDGLELEFIPTNDRGNYWRLNDITSGGTVKSITIEKGCSGMGLYRPDNEKFMCLGLINKSAPSGSFNAMKLIRAKCFASYFPDICDDSIDNLVQKNVPVPTEEESCKNMEASLQNTPDIELCNNFQAYMLIQDYKNATTIIEELLKRHPSDEWTILNHIRAISYIDHEKLKSLKDFAINYTCSTPQAAIYLARSFSQQGLNEIANEIWYRHATQFNDPEFDCMYYVEGLDPEFSKIQRKEYDSVEVGKCVLYDDKGKRHCLIASTKTQLGNSLIGKRKDDTIIVNIAGEERTITIIAIFDKYYSIVHRALKDVMEQGGNSILKPIKVDESMTGEEVLKLINDLIGEKESIEEQRARIYSKTPSLVMVADSDNMVGSYYRLLFADFKRMTRPERLINKHPLDNKDVEFVLDLSSVLTLCEKEFKGEVIQNFNFILPIFVYNIILDYRKNFLRNFSIDMQKAIDSGNIHSFNDDPKIDMEMRLDKILEWCKSRCRIVASPGLIKLITPQDDNRMIMFKYSVMLATENENRILLTEDWYIQPWVGLPYLYMIEDIM